MSQDWQFQADRLLPGGPDAYPEGAKEFVETAYRASLHLEEGQQLRFTCALVGPDAQVPYQVRLPDRPSATVQRLRKLGVGIAHGLGVLVAQGAAPPVLTGICSRRAAYNLLLHVMSPPPLIVTVRGLGEIRVDHGITSAVFSRDRYLEPTSDHEILSVIWPDIATSLVTQVEPESSRMFEQFSEKSEFVRDYVRTPEPAPGMHLQAARNVRLLAKAMWEHGGGGAALIVPNAETDPAKVTDKLHKLETPDVGEPCEEWSGKVMEVLALQTITPRNPPLRASLDDPYQKHMLEAHRFAEEEIQQTARLAVTDGALILNWVFTPLALGAKLKTGTDFSPQVAEFLREREKGMRHRSMATAVGALKGAVGLVVSSDGDCTLFGNRTGNVALDLVL